MTRDQARQILLLYRGNPSDACDPDIGAALAMADRDPELKSWLESHLAFQSAMRAKMREIKVPIGLKESLIARRKVVRPPMFVWWRQPAVYAAAAAIFVGLGVLTAVVVRSPAKPDRFAQYQSRMVGTALRQYRMDIVTNDMAQVRQFLASEGAPADYEVPDGLERLQLTGGGAIKWRSNPVSMVCFDRGTNQMLYLFVIRKEALKDAPADKMEVTSVGGLATASWSQGGKTYLLAGSSEPGFPEKYLQFQ